MGFINWLRTDFGSWLATVWLYLVAWGIVFVAFAPLLYMDGKFSRGLAEGTQIDPLAFQVLGWAFRFFAIIFLMAAERSRQKQVSRGYVWWSLGVFCSAIVFLHAVGIGLEALDDKRDNAIAVARTLEVKADASTDIIATLTAQQDRIRADLSTAVTSLDAEIKQYITDGLNNDDLADDSRLRRAELQEAAQAKIDTLDAEILLQATQGAQTTIEGASAAAITDKWAPLFVGLAQLITQTKNPTDWEIYLCAVGFLVFWVMLAESIVIFLPKEIYKFHLADAAEAKSEREVDETRSEAARKGWETRKARDRAPKKIAQAGTKSDPHRAEYWMEAVGNMLTWRRDRQPKITLARLVEKFGAGRTEPEFVNELRHAVKQGYVNQSDHDQLMQIPAIRPAENAENGEDDADDISSDQPN